MRVSVIGTVGVPAKYGGFETLVENIIDEKVSLELKYRVYCSSKSYEKKKVIYKGAELKYIPFKANGVQSVIYDVSSLIKARTDSDVILILGVSGCSFLPLFRIFFKKKIIVNIDGLEHKRDKWGFFARKFLKFSEAMAIKCADVIIVDNKGIQDYVQKEYQKETKLIAYGGDHVKCEVLPEDENEIVNCYNLERSYSFSVCRIVPENNVHLILEAFEKAGKRLLFVGNWMEENYGRNLYAKYQRSSCVTLLNPIYDVKTLNVLRSHCDFYIHGHSAGGTNPSLVEAMFFCKPVLAFDVVYNRETTENKAVYYSSAEELFNFLQKPLDCYAGIGESMYEIAERRYRWKYIAEQYESLY